jgi:lipoprotein-releasing system permease protein
LNLPFEWIVGLRYTSAKRRRSETTQRNGFISFIAAISMLGILLSVAMLITVLSVMNGFQKEVRDRMLSVLAHVEVSAWDGALPDWKAIEAKARTDSEVIGAAPYVSGKVLFTSGERFDGALLRGVLPSAEPEVSDLGRQMVEGRLTDLVAGQFDIILGEELARSFGVHVGDHVTVAAPEGQVTPAGLMPRFRQFTVVGVFASGHYEYDSTLALTHIDDAARLFRIDGPSGVRLKLRDMDAAPAVAYHLAATLGEDLRIVDWTRQNRSWFAAVKTEKTMMFVILTLIIAVAAFNLVSSLVMTVTDKQADIAILRTLGAAPGSVLAIFIIQGAIIGLVGCFAGVGLGLLLSYNVGDLVAGIEHLFGIVLIPQDVYFISKLPSDVRLPDVAGIAAVSVVLSLVATLYPSWRAARVQPAEALRYE